MANGFEAGRKLKNVVFVMVMVYALIFGVPVQAETFNGREIARMVYDREIGTDSYANVQILLIDKRGNKRNRTFISATKKYGDLLKTYIRFTSPADIEGTAFLTWENEGRDDDQFLYLPSLKRVRRIIASQKNSRFVNTDYTYEDLQIREVDEDWHQLLNEEKYNDFDCWVLESVPKDPDSTQYGKRISWIGKKSHVPVKVEYFDKRDRMVKRYRAAMLKKIDGIWTATEYEMHDVQREHRTLMKLTDIVYNSGVEDRLFSKTYLQYAN